MKEEIGFFYWAVWVIIYGNLIFFFQWKTLEIFLKLMPDGGIYSGKQILPEISTVV